VAYLHLKIVIWLFWNTTSKKDTQHTILPNGNLSVCEEYVISGLIDLTYGKTYKNSSQTTYTFTVAMVTTTS
jgi:hypothetical protein